MPAPSETLMVSVSGVRGIVGTDLTPEFVARYAAAFGVLARDTGSPRVVLARDARTSGLGPGRHSADAPHHDGGQCRPPPHDATHHHHVHDR